nr:MAG TPA: hypothetical protein [Inoviridae sp.]
MPFIYTPPLEARNAALSKLALPLLLTITAFLLLPSSLTSNSTLTFPLPAFCASSG